MNRNLDRLQPYPFEKLAALKAAVTPPSALDHISLSIGEPRHPTPGFITEEVLRHLHGLAVYPTTRGTSVLRSSICSWLTGRFDLPPRTLDPERHVLPVNGTREALFAFAQAVIDADEGALVLMPNPFYQIYEGAALLAGATPHFLPVNPASGLVPDFGTVPDDVWRRCRLVYVCTPGNPTGAVMDVGQLQQLIRLADEHDFVIASDECYSEIYFDETAPPPGLLQAAAAMGRDDFRRCVVFHSLSKRSNAPGLRSGFVAGDAGLIAQFLRYRTYHGCAMPPHHQAASVRAWSDEAHVRDNRRLYHEKFEAVVDILDDVLPLSHPAATFYLWPETPISDTEFARGLYARQNVTVLPGSYLSREVDGHNPGANRIRLALVAPFDECVDAASRIRAFTESL